MNFKLHAKLLLYSACLVLTLTLLVSAMGDTVEGPGERIYYQPSAGSVFFTHSDHVNAHESSCADGLELAMTQCADCHHELIKTNDVKSCTECHDEDEVSPEDVDHDTMKEMHPLTCTICHNVQEATEVSNCGKCHGEKGTGTRHSCDKCHEEDEVSADDFTHEELLEIDGHWCTECHSPRRKPDAIHTQCNSCHASLECFSYLGKDQMPDHEAFKCDICHLKTH